MEKMKLLIYKCQYFILVIIAVCLQSCNEEYLDKETTDKVEILRCYIDCTISNNSDTRTGTQYDWSDGDKLYICFKPGYTDCAGVATYMDGEWSISFNASTPKVDQEKQRCKVTFIKGDYTTVGDFLTMSDSSVIYTTEYGLFHVAEDGGIYISATLSPAFSRFRLKGEKGVSYEIKGIGYLSGSRINKWTGEVSNTKGIVNSKRVTCNISENGDYYTPYLYGNDKLEDYKYYTWNSSSSKNYCYTNSIIKIKLGSKVYAKEIDMYSGRSYSIVAPSSTNYDGWMVEDYVNKRVSIKQTDVDNDTGTVDIGVELDTKTGGVSVSGQLKFSEVVIDEYANASLEASSNERCYILNSPSNYHSSYFTSADIFNGGLYNGDEDEYEEGAINAYAWNSSFDLVDGLQLTYSISVKGTNSRINSGSYLYISNF